jgi:RNA polymerase sigma-70 factor (ECF subfamily)
MGPGEGPAPDDPAAGAESQGEGKPAVPPASKEGSHAPDPENSLRSSAARIQTPRADRPAGAVRKLRAVRPTTADGSSKPQVAGARPQRSTTPSRALQDLWVARLREGDEEALREVVHAFNERLTAVVAGVLRDRDAVEDVVQETFTKAFYRISSFRGGSSLYTWLYRVAVNAAKDYIKSRKRRPASSFDDLPGRASLPGGTPPLVEGLERRELRLAVRGAIARLPRRFRNVLALRELEGMAYNEIAEVLGLSLGTVESRLFRARKRLKALLMHDAGRGAAPASQPPVPKGPSSVDEKGQDS